MEILDSSMFPLRGALSKEQYEHEEAALTSNISFPLRKGSIV